MSKSVSIEQSHDVIQALACNVDWNVLDGDVLQEQIVKNPKGAGAEFTAFLKNGGKVVVGGTKVIAIDRSQPFDPVKFINEGWGIDEQDERSLALTAVDFTKVGFETCLHAGESSIQGEEKIERLKSKGYIRLDAKVFQTLWENQHLIPESCKEKVSGNTRYIVFDGTVLRDPDGLRCVLFMFFFGGVWRWRFDWLGRDRNVCDLSAVLTS